MFTYGFYDSLKGDRRYNAEQFGELFDGIVSDGIIPNYGQIFVVKTANNRMQITVGTGRAWFDRTWSKNDSVMILTVPPSDVTRPRYDAVVLEVNHERSVRANSIKIVQGTPEVNPMKPTLVNTDTIKQYPLAYILVSAGSSTVSASNIENMVGRTPTVFATAILQVTPIDQLWNQWKGEFEDWFDNIKTQLSGNIVANLQGQIDALSARAPYKATTAEAIAGLNDAKFVSPVGVKAAIEAKSGEIKSTDNTPMTIWKTNVIGVRAIIPYSNVPMGEGLVTVPIDKSMICQTKNFIVYIFSGYWTYSNEHVYKAIVYSKNSGTLIAVNVALTDQITAIYSIPNSDVIYIQTELSDNNGANSRYTISIYRATVTAGGIGTPTSMLSVGGITINEHSEMAVLHVLSSQYSYFYAGTHVAGLPTGVVGYYVFSNTSSASPTVRAIPVTAYLRADGMNCIYRADFSSGVFMRYDITTGSASALTTTVSFPSSSDSFISSYDPSSGYTIILLGKDAENTRNVYVIRNGVIENAYQNVSLRSINELDVTHKEILASESDEYGTTSAVFKRFSWATGSMSRISGSFLYPHVIPDSDFYVVSRTHNVAASGLGNINGAYNFFTNRNFSEFYPFITDNITSVLHYYSSSAKFEHLSRIDSYNGRYVLYSTTDQLIVVDLKSRLMFGVLN